MRCRKCCIVAFPGNIGSDECVEFSDSYFDAPVAECSVIARRCALVLAAPDPVFVPIFCRHEILAFFLQLRMPRAVLVLQMLYTVDSLYDLYLRVLHVLTPF